MPNKTNFGFRVVGVCFNCGYELSPQELGDNWQKGSSVIECDCPLCGHSMEAMLRVVRFLDLSIEASVWYYDARYLQWRLGALIKKSQRRTAHWQIMQDPALLWNVLNYYSTIQAALQSVTRGRFPDVTRAAA